MIWGCDYDLEGLGFDRDGIRIQLNCKDCNAFVEYTIFEDESPVLGGGMEPKTEFNIPLLLLGLSIVFLFSLVLWYVIDFFVGDPVLSTVIALAIVLLALNPPDEE